MSMWPLNKKNKSASAGKKELPANSGISAAGPSADHTLARPTRVSVFDDLIVKKGLESKSVILISGGTGSGKTTFVMQSLYEAALQGEKCLYISLEEEPEQLRRHMSENFNWKIDELEKKGLFGFMKLDAMQVAREVEGLIAQQDMELDNKIRTFALPFKPDRIAFDSLSALSLAFGKTENYRQFVRYLFKSWKLTGAITFVIAETEQNPEVYSRSGVEEFLADGVIVLYNIKQHNGIRQQALEILKIRNSKHQKRIVPFEITQKGIEIYIDQEIFQ